MPRPPNADLTTRQQQVLELLARGRTNPEIAETLGITLDGAKYHVREVFDKLGVDSREEAVAAWRRGAPSLLERLRGWLWPIGVVVAGVGVAAVAVVIVLVGGSSQPQATQPDSAAAHVNNSGATGGSGKAPTLPPHWQLWVATLTEHIEPGTTRATSTTLVVTEQSAGAKPSQQFSVDGDFLAVAWSPDGQLLAAASTDDRGHNQITIFSRANWHDRRFAVDDAPRALEWSPNGRYIAAEGSGLAIYRADGTLASAFRVPPAATSSASNGFRWSPGSTAVDAVIDDGIRVVGTDGSVTTIAEPPGLNFRPGAAWEWEDDSTPVIIGAVNSASTVAPPTAYAIHIEANPPRWTATTLTSTGAIAPLADAARAASKTAPKGTLDMAALTADGAFGIVGLFYPTGVSDSYRATLTAYVGERPFATLDLGEHARLPGSGSISAVVASGE